MATTDQWRTIEGWAEHLTGVGHDPTAACLLDLRRRVEALEQRAAAPEPAPAPAADRPLWEVVAQARYNSDGARMASVRLATAAEIDAVADWLAARKPVHGGAVVALRVQARRAREVQ